MSCKKPVLLLIDGVSRELVEKANCGFYAEPENIDDIVEKINWCIDNKNIIPKFGENGYNYAKKHFDRSVLSNEYIQALELLVNQR